MTSLRARFVLDNTKRPTCIRRKDLLHYAIELFVEDAPDDAIGTTYELDETYYDPLLESRDGASGFAGQITAYGDYIVMATVRSKKPIRLRKSLYAALGETYSGMTDPDIRKALADIQSH